MLRAEVGLQVATVDVGGWDTHTDEAHDLDAHLGLGRAVAGGVHDRSRPGRGASGSPSSSRPSSAAASR